MWMFGWNREEFEFERERERESGKEFSSTGSVFKLEDC